MSYGYDPYSQPQQAGPQAGYGQAATACAAPYAGYQNMPFPPFVTQETAPADVSLGEAVKRMFSRYAQFRGAASRSELWYAVLASVLISIVPQCVLYGGMISFFASSTYDEYGTMVEAGSPGLMIMGAVLSSVAGLALFVPSLAVTVRRLHDSGRSGLWYLITFVPCVGTIWLLVLLVSERHVELWRPEWF